LTSQSIGQSVRNRTITQRGGRGIEETIAKERESRVVGWKGVKMLNLMHRR
jgi:hypothetical protein